MKLKTEKKFDAAHRLYGYDGACANLHGHTWRVEVEIEETFPEYRKDGIWVDFKDLKTIIDGYDHKVILNKIDPLVEVLHNSNVNPAVILMKGNPTAENLSERLADQISSLTHLNGTMIVRVWESATSYAEAKRG